MAFQFPLAILLRFRQSVERREELALQRISHEIVQCRQQIDRLDARIAEAQKARTKALERPISAFQLQSMLSEARLAVELRHSLIDSLVPLEKKRIEQLAVYQAALRDRKILSELESKRFEAYKVEYERAQQKKVDDIFAARAHRS